MQIPFKAIALATTSIGLAGSVSADPLFSPYKDTAVQMNWSTNTIQTKASGTTHTIAYDLTTHGASALTVAFATGACGSENWSGAPGSSVASVNMPKFIGSQMRYVISTGGQGGVFTCSSDSGMKTFINRWNSPYLVGVDFDIEDSQTASQITSLVQRVKAMHTAFPALRFSFTMSTQAHNNGGGAAVPGLGQGKGVGDPYNDLNTTGNTILAAIRANLGWSGTVASWPTYVTINLMVMDYGSPASSSLCVIASGKCQMAQSAIQAAYNLNSAWNIPYTGIELTPMIGGNDNTDEKFQLADTDVVSSFVLTHGLAGLHYWSYDRDVPCATGAAKDTCNSMGTSTARYGYLQRFLSNGLH